MCPRQKSIACKKIKREIISQQIYQIKYELFTHIKSQMIFFSFLGECMFQHRHYTIYPHEMVKQFC